MNNKKGTLYLFSGLAGAGKTTLGTLFYERLRERKDNVFLFDSDRTGLIRMEKHGGYDVANRVLRAHRTLGVCRALTEQGIDVVCCIIAVFDELTEWCRENVENFCEIYIKVSMETLRARDQKGLYSSGAPDVVGVDLPYDEPKTPDIVVLNEGTQTPEEIITELERKLGL